ncbi:hypothetical protein N9060_00435 [Arenicella sp.]|nr:hypothetical protein [Arenicella sp.]
MNKFKTGVNQRAATKPSATTKFNQVVKPSLVALAVAQSLSMATAQAATIHVGGPNGAGCGFTAAILSANNDATPPNSQCVAGSGDDVIELHRDITLRKAWRANVNGMQQDTAFGTPLITSNVTINGNGHTITRDSNAPDFAIMSANGGEHLTLNDLTVSNGANPVNVPPLNNYTRLRGIGIDSHYLELTLNNVTVENHTGGPAVYDVGGFRRGQSPSIVSINDSEIWNNEEGFRSEHTSTVKITKSTISSNSLTALDVYAQGSLDIIDSQIDNNGAGLIVNMGHPIYFAGAVDIINSSFNNNVSSGINVYNIGSIGIVDSEISNNTGSGISATKGGYFSYSSLIIDNTTISNNSTNGNGGAIDLRSTSQYGTDVSFFDLTISDSTLTGNSASRNGGAINSAGPSTNGTGPSINGGLPHTIINSTISGNSAGGSGGAIYLEGDYDFGYGANSPRKLTFLNSTVIGNSASEGGAIATGEVGRIFFDFSNSIIAGNSATVSSSEINNLSALNYPNEDLIESNNNVFGSSLESNFSAFNGFTPSASDITATIDGSNPTILDDIAGPLQDNAGATQTHALPAGSPAIDAGDLDTCLNDPVNGLDQRGETRGEAAFCDIGAYEVQGNVGDMPTISIDSIEVFEGDPNATLTISLSSPQTERIPVDFQTMDGSATDGLDYTGRFGTMTFAPGQTQKVRSIQLVDDNLGESTESFSLLLSNPVGATLEQAVGEVTILDDDGLPTISIESADHSVNEGDSGNSRRIVYTITLSSAQTERVSVDYQTMDESAVGGVDYEIRTGSMTFMPGQTSKIRAIKVLGDTQTESDETFKLVLSNPSTNAAVNVDDADSVGTILDDD